MNVLVAPWRSMCAFSLLSWMKLWPQTLQAYGFSPVWMRMCLFRFCWRVKPAPQVSHVKVLPLWTAWCVLSDLFIVKALSHTLHLKGCSPLWTLLWHCRVKAYLKLCSHSVHLCGFSTVWTTWWACRLRFVLKAFPQVEHTKGLTSVWTTWWVFKFILDLKVLSQTWHLYKAHFFSSCRSMWCSNFTVVLNFLGHWSQEYSLCSWCVFMCFSRWNRLLKLLLQTSHRKTFSVFLTSDVVWQSGFSPCAASAEAKL